MGLGGIPARLSRRIRAMCKAKAYLGSFSFSGFCILAGALGPRLPFCCDLPAMPSSPPSSLSPSGWWLWGCSPSRRSRSSRGWPTPSRSWPYRCSGTRSPRPTRGPWRRARSPHWAWPSWPLTVTKDALNGLWAEGSHNIFNGRHHQLDCRSKSRVHPRPSWPSWAPRPSWASRWRWWRS
jgi:hypothetical protein